MQTVSVSGKEKNFNRVAHGIKMQENPKTMVDIFRVFTDFHGILRVQSPSQFALLHGNLINSISMKLSIFKSCTNFFSELQHLCNITYRYCFDFLTYLMEISKKNPE